MYKIGDQVVFKDDYTELAKRRMNRVGDIIPIVNCIYTVRDIHTPDYTGQPYGGFLLREIVNKARYWRKRDGGKEYGEPGYKIARFRPVKRTDISCFTSILTKKSEYV